MSIPISATGDCMTVIDLRQHYATGGKLASRAYIYALEQRGELPPSALLGGKRVWSRRAVLERDAARFREAEQRAQNVKAAQ